MANIQSERIVVLKKNSGNGTLIADVVFHSQIIELNDHNGHELWVVIENNGYKCVSGLNCRYRVRSSDIRREIDQESPLLHVEKSQLR